MTRGPGQAPSRCAQVCRQVQRTQSENRWEGPDVARPGLHGPRTQPTRRPESLSSGQHSQARGARMLHPQRPGLGKGERMQDVLLRASWAWCGAHGALGPACGCRGQ